MGKQSKQNSPLFFVTEVLGAEPEPHQVDALNAVEGNSHVAIRSAHDQGKTALLAWVAWWFISTHYPCKIPIAANTQDQLRDVTWPEVMRWGRWLPDQLRASFDIGLERITMKAMPEDAFMVGRTASRSNPEALQGFHSPHLLFLLEEASGMEDIIFEVASGAMSSKDARALMIANPTRSMGYFRRAFTVNREMWKGLHWPWRLNPWSSPDYPKRMAAEYGGETSNVYKVRVLGDFPTSEDNAVIPLNIIEPAMNRDVERTTGRSVVWGLDIARFGDDRCALAKRQGNHLLEKVKVWRHMDLMQTCGVVSQQYFETPTHMQPVAINADVIGIGAGVVDRLRELGLPVFGINVGETASDGERFTRMRSELWWKARDWFFARDCRIPEDDETLVSDLVGPTYKMLSSGKLEVESKDDMKKRGLKSPDAADAFCLTFAGGEYAQDYRRHTHAVDDSPRNVDEVQPVGYYVGAQQTHAIE